MLDGFFRPLHSLLCASCELSFVLFHYCVHVKELNGEEKKQIVQSYGAFRYLHGKLHIENTKEVSTFFLTRIIRTENCTKKTDCSFKLAKLSTFERISFSVFLSVLPYSIFICKLFFETVLNRWQVKMQKIQRSLSDVIQMEDIFQNS